MATATAKTVFDFFKTGDVERDRSANLMKEWKALSDEEKAWFKDNVPA